MDFCFSGHKIEYFYWSGFCLLPSFPSASELNLNAFLGIVTLDFS